MDKPVSKVVKSKSSNSAVYTKTDKGNKKSRSNAEFQPNVLKKRGMYVEKKSTRSNINDPVSAPTPPKQKAPPRPRPGSKRFLTSVLNILSKSTTGTQHPDLNDPKSSKLKNNPSALRKKRKYRSKILNEQPDEKLIVLQSTKDIINTPSIYSERSQDTFKTNYSRVVKNYDVVKIDKGTVVDVKKRQRKDKKVTIDDPSTLVQDKKVPGLYNFFVDLLQTTFSACDMKDRPNTELKKPSVSKVELAINESVAKKLNIVTQNEPCNLTEKESNLCCMIDDNWSDLTVIEQKPPPIEYSEINLIPTQKYTKPRKIESFNRNVMLPKVYSGLFPTKKSYTAKNKKKIVLNLLKRELRMGADFMEPENLYQALRNIARNKRKYQKTIRFTKVDSGDECVFKQKKVISDGKSKKRVEKSKSSRIDSYNSKKTFKEFTSEESFHSLEVYDYDYEIDQKRRREKKIFYARPSFTSMSDFNRINDDFVRVSEEFF